MDLGDPIGMSSDLWKKIPDFENYEISVRGEILRHRRSARPLRIHGSPSPRGTPQVVLTKDGRRRRIMLSRLMLEVFEKPYPIDIKGSELVVSFYNGDPRDCHINNLYWSTRRNIARKVLLYDFSRAEMTKSPIRCTNIDTGERVIFNCVDECAKAFDRDPVEIFDMTDGFLDDCEWQYSWH